MRRPTVPACRRTRAAPRRDIIGSVDDGTIPVTGLSPAEVVQVENDYDKEVYNGDIGFIEDVDADAGELRASFDGRSVTYGFGELDALVLAYAVTIHKSQGSEYPAVVIPVTTQHYAMLQRNLLYTGLTRGKKLVVLVGQKKAVAIAVRNVSGRRRWSKLCEWLNNKASGSGSASASTPDRPVGH
jgi:exodeoxyribonuclease V alpha subunit